MEELSVSRNFGFIDIQWQISNFCFETAKEDFVIHTPVIFVEGIHTTTWKMILSPRKKVNEAHYFYLILERLNFENESDDVTVNLKVWLTDYKGEECAVRWHSMKCRGNQLYEIMIVSENYVREKIKPLLYTNWVLFIRCLLLVKHKTEHENFHEPSLPGLKSLSDDLLGLFKNGTDCDIALKIKDGNIYAHKAILCSRSKIIAESVESDGDSKVVDLSSYDYIDYETAKDLFAYAYSGDIGHISRNPSVSMYESAISLGISGIKEYFNPHCLSIRSEIDFKRYNFSWVIRECAQITEHCILSPIFVADNMDTTWRLSLYMNGVDYADNYLSVFADVVKGEKPGNCCFAFAILDDSGDLWSEKKNVLNDSTGVFGFKNFISKDYFKFRLEKLALDIVHVVFRIDIYTNAVSTYDEYALNDVNPTADHFYLTLSKELKKTLEEGTYADFVLESEGVRCKVPKSIISARSPVLKAFLASATDERSFTIDMKSSVLRTVLQYVYSGVCDHLVEQEIFDLYKAAEYLSLHNLKGDCTRFLKEHLSVESVFNVLAFSHEQKNEDLKSSALNFIFLNRSRVFLEKGWEDLVLKYPFVCAEVEAYIKLNSV